MMRDPRGFYGQYPTDLNAEIASATRTTTRSPTLVGSGELPHIEMLPGLGRLQIRRFALLQPGIFGTAWVAIANESPRGWKHVQCPRCNAKQNVPKDGGECWQCKTPLSIQTPHAKQS